MFNKISLNNLKFLVYPIISLLIYTYPRINNFTFHFDDCDNRINLKQTADIFTLCAIIFLVVGIVFQITRHKKKVIILSNILAFLILATLFNILFRPPFERSHNLQAKHNTKSIQNTLEMYYDIHNTYPQYNNFMDLIDELASDQNFGVTSIKDYIQNDRYNKCTQYLYCSSSQTTYNLQTKLYKEKTFEGTIDQDAKDNCVPLPSEKP